MSDTKKAFETGFVFNVPKGCVSAVMFEDQGDGTALGITPDGRASWVSGVFKLGVNLFRDRADAVKAAEADRLKRVAALRKQLAKLEALRFD